MLAASAGAAASNGGGDVAASPRSRAAQASTLLQLALIEHRLTRKYREQCRLAGAVAPDQSEPLASQYRELRSIEERPLAEGDVRIAN